jgi:FkbM family methyltransferase
MNFKEILQKNFITYYFYKKLKIFRNSTKNKHLGEFGEDIFIRRFFKNEKKGFYVDIGCYHPIKGSLTYYLFKEGWKGLNVDLSKISVDLFKTARPNDHNINAAVTDFDGETFYYENGAINQQNSLISHSDNKKIKIQAYKLATLLNNLSISNIDYLNIDVEGSDFKVILSLDFSKYRPKLISIDQNIYNSEKIIKNECHEFLSKKNYFLASKIGVTCIYIDNKYEDLIEKIMSI